MLLLVSFLFHLCSASWFEGPEYNVGPGRSLAILAVDSHILRLVGEKNVVLVNDNDPYWLEEKDELETTYQFFMEPLFRDVFDETAFDHYPLLIRRVSNLRRFLTVLPNMTDVLFTFRSSLGTTFAADGAQSDEMIINDDYRLVKQVLNDNDGRLWSAGLAQTPADVAAKIEEGYTLIFNRLHLRNKAIAQVCRRLMDLFGVWCGANAYITPRDQEGFALHHDTQDALIVQLQGAKAWRVCGSWPVSAPMLPYHEAKPPNEDVGEPCSHVILQAGDTLFLPRGTLHQATTKLVVPQDHFPFSYHLTFGLESGFVTLCECLHFVGEQLLEGEDLAAYHVVLHGAALLDRNSFLRRLFAPNSATADVQVKLGHALRLFVIQLEDMTKRELKKIVFPIKGFREWQAASMVVNEEKREQLAAMLSNCLGDDDDDSDSLELDCVAPVMKGFDEFCKVVRQNQEALAKQSDLELERHDANWQRIKAQDEESAKQQREAEKAQQTEQAAHHEEL